MHYVIKNFMRNRMVNLTAKSIRHFDKSAHITALTLYKENYAEEYKDQPILLECDNISVRKTKWVSPRANAHIHDSTVYGETSGFGNPLNGPFFVEGYNLAFELFSDLNDKLVILAEDHFFTSGMTIKELQETDWDAAYAPAFSGGRHDANGAIIAIVPTKVAHLFPLAEYETSIEPLLGQELLMQLPSNRVHRLSTRKWTDYCGDGIYTNSSVEMEQEMAKAGIL